MIHTFTERPCYISFGVSKVAKFECERYVTKTFVICLAAARRRADTKI